MRIQHCNYESKFAYVLLKHTIEFIAINYIGLNASIIYNSYYTL